LEHFRGRVLNQSSNYPSGEYHERLFTGAAERPLELVLGASAHVEDLLVNPHRELRVPVPEEVHRAPGRDTQLRQDRGEGAPKCVRRELRDRREPRRLQQLVACTWTGATMRARTLSGVLRVSKRVANTGSFGP
jgi:hypothetical protein